MKLINFGKTVKVTPGHGGRILKQPRLFDIGTTSNIH
jgi:hypothetical protein